MQWAEEVVLLTQDRLEPTAEDWAGLDARGISVDESDKLGVIVLTDPSRLKSVPGVYAAANVRACNVQVVEATGEGLNAAVAVNASLAQERAREAVRQAGRGSSVTGSYTSSPTCRATTVIARSCVHTTMSSSPLRSAEAR